MTEKDIEIGAKYSNKACPGCVYLGSGYYTGGLKWVEDTTKEKYLVLIENKYDPSLVGVIVRRWPEIKRDFWDGFKKIE